ncbi:hypothetical protein BMS3Abin15_01120 [bacterium BMS3Abin15]|nr:hypothetical protein BMS3Abin15_01120 [bacterium BMS3Abin15]
MSLKSLLKANIVAFLLYFAVQYIAYNYPFSYSGVLVAALGFFVMFLSGANIIALFKILFKFEIDIWEFISLSLVSIFIVHPLVLLIEYQILGKIIPDLPIYNVTLFLVALFLVSLVKKINFNTFIVFKEAEFNKKFYSYSLFWAILVSTTVTILIFSAYNHLPDKDPFTWLFRYSNLFENGSLPSIGQRPLFATLTYTFTNILNIEIFDFFKYVLPLLSLSVIAPAWLIARNYNSVLKQLLILLAVLATPNTLLYSQIAMPQIMFILLLYYFTFFLLYSYIKKSVLFYYLAGAISAIAIFYHEVAIIIFLIWLLVTLYSKRHVILKNKTYLILVILLIISNYSTIERYAQFVLKWIIKIFKTVFFHPQINYLFPVHYKNVDGNQMGWEGLSGLVKYYSFYVGPFIILLSLLLFYLLVRKVEFRKKFLHVLASSGNTIIIFLCFFVFFVIAEIFPRFPGIAMLPDRSWIFAGIFYVLFIFIFLESEKDTIKIKNWVYVVLLASVLISISGALYINYQKKYLITEKETESATWIRKNIPPDRIILNTGKRNLLRHYSKSETVRVSEAFFYNENISEIMDIVGQIYPSFTITESKILLDDYSKKIKINAAKYQNEYLRAISNDQQNKILEQLAQKNIKDSEEFINLIKGTDPQIDISEEQKIRGKNLFIYYSEVDERNPYFDRPYVSSRWGLKSINRDSVIFFKYPDKFQKIYESENSEIIIWKVL